MNDKEWYGVQILHNGIKPKIYVRGIDINSMPRKTKKKWKKILWINKS